MNIIQNLISNNFSPGRYGGRQIKRIVLHTYGGKGTNLYNFFNSVRPAPSSAHYSVEKDGTVRQYVLDKDTAFHAGTSATSTLPNNNWESIGIEHQDDGNSADGLRTKELYEASAQLVAMLCKKYNVPVRLLTKSDRFGSGIAPHNYYSTKPCPGGLVLEWIINRALQINNTPMAQFDFTLSKVGADIHLIMNQQATGKFIVKDKITGAITDQGNILDGLDNKVSPNCSKRLYQVTFNGLTKELDLRDPVIPVPNLQEQLDSAHSEISRLDALRISLEGQVATLSSEKNGLALELSTAQGDNLELRKTIEDKDKTIALLREKKPGIIEWIISLFKKS